MQLRTDTHFPLYLDNASTTKVDYRVLEAMLPYFSDFYGNPSASNHHSVIPNRAIEDSRVQISHLIGCSSENIIFNSGSTESINHVLKSLFFSSFQRGKNRLLISSIEHKAVIETANYLESLGCEVLKIPVDSNSVIDLDQLTQLINDNTFLICVMLVNNETGVVQPLSDIVSLAREKNIPVFSDATQAIGKMHVDLKDFDVDYLCLSAHKINGPKGVGALYSKKPYTLEPLLHGGGQEKSRRGGTYNVPGIVGLGRAAEIINDELDSMLQHYKKQKFYILEQIIGDDGFENFSMSYKVPNIISVSLHYEDNDEYLTRNRFKLSASTGSACNAEVVQDSHVLKAIPGLDPKKVIRISI